MRRWAALNGMENVPVLRYVQAQAPTSPRDDLPSVDINEAMEAFDENLREVVTANTVVRSDAGFENELVMSPAITRSASQPVQRPLQPEAAARLRTAVELATRLRSMDWEIVPIYYHGNGCLAHNVIIHAMWIFCEDVMSGVPEFVAQCLLDGVVVSP
jgi:hypothetical protein